MSVAFTTERCDGIECDDEHDTAAADTPLTTDIRPDTTKEHAPPPPPPLIEAPPDIVKLADDATTSVDASCNISLLVPRFPLEFTSITT